MDTCPSVIRWFTGTYFLKYYYKDNFLIGKNLQILNFKIYLNFWKFLKKHFGHLSQCGPMVHRDLMKECILHQTPIKSLHFPLFPFFFYEHVLNFRASFVSSAHFRLEYFLKTLSEDIFYNISVL